MELVAACTNVKIKPGNTESITAFIKKEVTNSNINIAMSAI
jgi:hypothetical protein